MADWAEDMVLKEEYFESINCQNFQQNTNQELVEIIDCYVEDN